MINPDNFFWIVTLLAVVYAVLIRIIQSKLMDQEKMKSLQKRMNELNKEQLSALRSSNTKRLEAIQKQQQELMPEFNKMLMGQFKIMGVIIIIFLGFMAVINSIDPFPSDDVPFELTSLSSAPGQWCGELTVLCPSPGPHLIHVTAYSEGSEKGTNSTIIFCGRETGILPSPVQKGTLFPITTDKKVYQHNDKALICITAPEGTDRAAGTSDSGTWFMVELPFTIPVLEAKAINGANVWFIVCSILFGLVFSQAWSRIKKKGGQDAKKKG